jgi:H+/Cl- antiporter ClcA
MSFGQPQLLWLLLLAPALAALAAWIWRRRATAVSSQTMAEVREAMKI